MPLARRWMSSEEEEKSRVLLTPRRSQPSVVGVRQLQPFRVVWLFSDQYFSVIIRDLSGIHALNARRRPLRRGVFVLNLSPSEEPEAVQRADWWPQHIQREEAVVIHLNPFRWLPGSNLKGRPHGREFLSLNTLHTVALSCFCSIVPPRHHLVLTFTSLHRGTIYEVGQV